MLGISIPRRTTDFEDACHDGGCGVKSPMSTKKETPTPRICEELARTRFDRFQNHPKGFQKICRPLGSWYTLM